MKYFFFFCISHTVLYSFNSLIWFFLIGFFFHAVKFCLSIHFRSVHYCFLEKSVNGFFKSLLIPTFGSSQDWCVLIVLYLKSWPDFPDFWVYQVILYCILNILNILLWNSRSHWIHWRNLSFPVFLFFFPSPSFFPFCFLFLFFSLAVIAIRFNLQILVHFLWVLVPVSVQFSNSFLCFLSLHLVCDSQDFGDGLYHRSVLTAFAVLLWVRFEHIHLRGEPRVCVSSHKYTELENPLVQGFLFETNCTFSGLFYQSFCLLCCHTDPREWACFCGKLTRGRERKHNGDSPLNVHTTEAPFS